MVQSFATASNVPGDDGWRLDDIEINGLVATPASVSVDDKDNSGLPGPGGVDMDVDGFIDTCDNCPSVANPSQSDGDMDTIGDMCDICPYTNDNFDPDLDQVCAAADNCPFVANPDQTDADADDYGAACDCNDGNANINPAGIEINNAVDDDCDGVSDELSDVTATKAGATTTFDWPGQALAQRYQVTRSSAPILDTDCFAQILGSNSYDETTTPSSGDVMFFAFRARLPNLGSWGQDSDGIERTGTCLP